MTFITEHFIDLYRQRIARAAVARIITKTGASVIFVTHNDGTAGTYEVDFEEMLKILRNFEAEARKDFGSDSREFIHTCYSSFLAVGKNGEHLTALGKHSIDEMLRGYAQLIRENYAGASHAQAH